MEKGQSRMRLFIIFICGKHFTGTTKSHRLTENIGGASINLSINDIKKIDYAFSQTTIHGDRYPAHLQKRVGK